MASFSDSALPASATSPPRPALSPLRKIRLGHPRVIWAAPTVPAPRPGRAPGTLNLRPPFTNRGGEQIPGAESRGAPHSESSWPRDPFQARDSPGGAEAVAEGQPAGRRRDGATEALARLARGLGYRGRRRPPATAWARVSRMARDAHRVGIELDRVGVAGHCLVTPGPVLGLPGRAASDKAARLTLRGSAARRRARCRRKSWRRVMISRWRGEPSVGDRPVGGACVRPTENARW